MTVTSKPMDTTADMVIGNAATQPPVAPPTIKQPIKNTSAASILSTLTASQPPKTTPAAPPTSLGGLPREISPTLGSPEPETPGLTQEDAASVAKKMAPSTKSSFEHFKRQAMEKSERVRAQFCHFVDVCLCNDAHRPLLLNPHQKI